MSNMSYCRFQNTLSDLRDCQEALDDGALDNGDLSPDEDRAARALIRRCADIAVDYDDRSCPISGVTET